MDIALSLIVSLVVIFLVPMLVYALFSSAFGIKEPDKKLSFFLGVLIQKIGTTVGFVALFYLGREYFLYHWLQYGVIWFAMFVITEIGQIFMSDYSKKEAVAGIVSEALYFPLSAYIISLLLG